MNYDEIKQEQLVSDTAEESTQLANTMLKSMEEYITNSHSQSPLARFYNLMQVLHHMDDIIDQAHNAALDYIREQTDKKARHIGYYTQEEAAKQTPAATLDGVTYQWLRWANFRNIATKDKVLNGLLISEKETDLALQRIEGQIIKRITQLRATDEYKKAKPTKAWEAISLKI